jgi:hypothetical protein
VQTAPPQDVVAVLVMVASDLPQITSFVNDLYKFYPVRHNT